MNVESTSSVVVVLPNFVLKGDLATRSLRVIDLLNDQSTRFLPVENMGIFDRDSNDEITSVRKANAIKDAIEMVLLDEGDGVGDRKAFFVNQERRTAEAVITLATSVVKGRVNLKTAKDPQAFLSIDAGRFIAVTDVTIYNFSTAINRLKSRVAIISTSAISSLSFVE